MELLPKPEGAFRVAHFSDVHLPTIDHLPFRYWFSKPMTGWLNWRSRRRHQYSPEIFRSLLSAVETQRPDHTVITGDLTNFGLPQEIASLRSELMDWAAVHSHTVIPGNHDVYISDAVSQVKQLWRPWMEDGPYEGSIEFPIIRKRGPVAIIGVNSAVPTLPFISAGTIDSPQLFRLDAALNQLGEQGYFRLILVHHPPRRQEAAWHKRLRNNELFQRIIMRSGAELILFGHIHRNAVASIVGPVSSLPIMSTSSASSRSEQTNRQSTFMLHDISKTSGGFLLTSTAISNLYPQGFCVSGSKDYTLPTPHQCPRIEADH